LLLLDATHQLSAGLFAGLPRPEPVNTVKKQFPGWSSIGFAEWRIKAGHYLRTALMAEELSIFVAVDPKAAPKSVPACLLERLITGRGLLTNRPIRLPLAIVRAAGVGEEYFWLFNSGVLVVDAAEFNHWYRSQRTKGKWPSQRQKRKKGRGAPTKQSEGLRSRIRFLVQAGKWRADKRPEGGGTGIEALRRLLLAEPDFNVPSTDTLGRLLKNMHTETGDPALRRKHRTRRSTTKNTAKFPDA
jgi:hypothetical protein